MIIGCDIDHTITDTEELETKLVKRYLNSIGFKGEIVDPDNFFVLARYGFSENDCWNFYDTFGAEMLSNAPIKEGCDKVIHALRECGDKIIFISARGLTHMLDYNPYVLTHKWMKSRGIEYDKMICRYHQKADLAAKNNVDLFIDDSITVCRELSSKNIPTILITAPHNKKETDLPNNCTRADNWEQIYSIILKIKEAENENLAK